MNPNPTPHKSVEEAKFSEDRFQDYWKDYHADSFFSPYGDIAKSSFDFQDSYYLPLLSQKDAELTALRARLEKADKFIEIQLKLDAISITRMLDMKEANYGEWNQLFNDLYEAKAEYLKLFDSQLPQNKEGTK